MRDHRPYTRYYRRKWISSKGLPSGIYSDWACSSSRLPHKFFKKQADFKGEDTELRWIVFTGYRRKIWDVCVCVFPAAWGEELQLVSIPLVLIQASSHWLGSSFLTCLHTCTPELNPRQRESLSKDTVEECPVRSLNCDRVTLPVHKHQQHTREFYMIRITSATPNSSRDFVCPS